MVDEMRKQLDALMGADRNGDMSISSFQDHQVCKFFLAGLCPNELFNNTVRRPVLVSFYGSLLTYHAEKINAPL